MNENEKIDDITTEADDLEAVSEEAADLSEELEIEPAPRRRAMAWVRFTIAACLALLILCLTGFGAFKMLLGGGELTKENLVAGKYLTFNVDTLLDYIAEDYAADSDTVTGRYAVVSVDGDVSIVHFPQRYLDSADKIAMQTYYQLYGYTGADQYFTASGTVKKASDEIVEQYKSWYNTNALALYQYGFIDDVASPENVLIVDVDSTGLFNDTVCTILSIASGVLLIYAAVVFALIKTKHYDDEITVEIFEDTEDTAQAEYEAETEEQSAAPAAEEQETENEP